MMLLSDHATPDGNHFTAYGAHTFRWVNDKGEAVFVKVSTPLHTLLKRSTTGSRITSPSSSTLTKP